MVFLDWTLCAELCKQNVDRSVMSIRDCILELIQKSSGFPLGQTFGQMQRFATEEAWALELETGGSEVQGCPQL